MQHFIAPAAARSERRVYERALSTSPPSAVNACFFHTESQLALTV